MSASPTFWELALAAPAEVGEALANFLWEHRALGVVESPEAAGGALLRAFFPPDIDPAGLERDVRGYLDGLGALGFAVDGTPRVLPVEDADWAQAWREHFRPIRVGRRLLVVPPWSTARPRGRLRLVIEPGRAFGTGHHGSTATCLVQLERATARRRVPFAIDLGTGSGILAIAAARLGVRRVLAVDEDADAVAVARENAAANGVGDRIECVAADAAALRTEPAPLVVANILAAAHVRLADRYAGLVAPGGLLVVGGILDAEAADVRRALEAAGFAFRSTARLDGWTSLALDRRGPAPARARRPRRRPPARPRGAPRGRVPDRRRRPARP